MREKIGSGRSMTFTPPTVQLRGEYIIRDWDSIKIY
jgi:hypothetical protein